MPPPLSSLPDDPARWVTGHELVADDRPGTPDTWDYDTKTHHDWEDPAIRRRLIGTPEELVAVADAVVHQKPLTATYLDGNEIEIVGKNGNVAQHVIVEDLRALVEAVQSHPDVRLAHVDTEKDADGFLHVNRRWITDVDGNELPPHETEPTEPSHLQLWQCIVLKAECSDLDTRIAFYARARFVADALFIGANFADMASFRWMSFAAGTRFDGASFAWDGDFGWAIFAGVARFGGASFAEEASFHSASFAGEAWFNSASFAGRALFRSASFAGLARFHRASFAGQARFASASFAGTAWFTSASFADAATFGSASFAGTAQFGEASFAEEASFHSASFAGEARFGSASFAGEARFGSASFARGAWFDSASFARGAWFGSASFAGYARFVSASFAGEASFDSASFADAARFGSASFAGDAVFAGATINGHMFFTRATIDRRLILGGDRITDATLGPDGRLGFDKLVVRAGATVEVSAEQLQLRHEVPLVVSSGLERWILDSSGTRWRIWALQYFAAAVILPPLSWIDLAWARWPRGRSILMGLGFRTRGRLILGEASEDAGQLSIAASDYNLLRDLFRNQPSTDKQEEICAIRHHDLKRRADVRSIKGWKVDALWQRGKCFFHWLVMRNMLGYLIDPWRIVMTVFVLLGICALIYGVFASESTVLASGNAIPVCEFGLIDRITFGVYFSLTTFVTLGYGDYAPTNWLKVVTGVEALLGVTLLALFTVAWGRKMVR